MTDFDDAPRNGWDLDYAPEANEDQNAYDEQIDFWCEFCRAWLRPAYNEPTPRCTRCGEDFTCGECGYVINRQGDCLRPGGHSGEEF